MSNASIRRLIGGLGALLVFLICGILIGIHFAAGRNAQRIDVTEYTVIQSDGSGGYTAKLDADRLIYEERLTNPPAAELDNFPAIKVLKNLIYSVSQKGDSYVLNLQMKEGVVEGEVTDILKQGGIRLINVEWTLSRAEMEQRSKAAAQQAQTSSNGDEPAFDGKLDFSAYVRTRKTDGGDYEAVLDVYRMLTDAGLDPAADPETNVGVKALRSLGVNVQKTADGYTFQTTSTLPTVEDDLKTAGLRIVNTKWTWNEAETAAHQGTVTPLPEPEKNKNKIDFSAYVRTNRKEDGAYEAKLDLYQMLTDAGLDPATDPETSIGAKALRSLDVAMEKTADGYKFQTTSTLPSVMDDLKAAGMQITNTQWTWTEAEMASHAGTVRPLPAPPTAEPTPDRSAEASAAPEPTPGETQQPVTPTPVTTPAHDPNAIDSLYGFDQTEVRKAIRAAKEQKYGTALESSEVKYNYFAVGNNSTEHANVFRLVYTITKSGGTEYLIADVYDLVSETGYQAKDVHLTATSDRAAAKSTADLKDYHVYTLNEGSMVFPENNGKSPFDDDGLVMPKSISEALTYDELWNIPATEDMTLLRLLGYARNEMFARGGHQFSDTSNYRKFYSQYSWYKPTGKVSADELAKKYPATKGNITTIKFLEKLIKEG